MTRYALTLIALIGISAAAIANGVSAHSFQPNGGSGLTVIAMTDMPTASLAHQKLMLQKCAFEDCSDTPQ